MEWTKITALAIGAAVSATMATGPAHAQQANSDLQARVRAMEEQLKELKDQLKKTQQTAEQAKNDATEESTRNIKFLVTGYTTADFTGTHNHDGGGQTEFGAGSFNPIFIASYKDLVTAEAELELTVESTGETKTALEFGNISVNAADWMTLTAGRFLSPIGDFQQHQHPTWINKLPDRPAGFVEDGGVEHLSEVGLMARGAVPAGSMTADYALFVGNGPRLADDPAEGIRTEGYSSDDNDNKAIGGRIGLRPVPYVSVGVGGLHSQIKGHPGTGGVVTTANYNLWDVDAAYTKDYLNVRGEFIHAHLGSLNSALADDQATQVIPASTWRAWYLQAAYRLAGISDNEIVGNFEPVVRYSQYHITGLDEFKELAENRWTVGLNYWFAPSIVTKAAYEHKNFKNSPDESVYRMQIAYGF